VSADIMEASRLLAVDPDAAITLLHQLNARYPGRDDILSRRAGDWERDWLCIA
jgi:hypothetical protein